MFAAFWLVYGIAVLTWTVGFACCLAVSPRLRRRVTAGGRIVWPMLLGFSLAGAGAIASWRFFDGSSLPVLPGMALFFIWSQRHRARLAGARAHDDSERLSPAVRRFIDGPSVTHLLRHPLAANRENLRTIRANLSAGGRRAEKQWDREQGLR